MTEAGWLAATDPTAMRGAVREAISDRRLRLFAVACCRRAWRLMQGERSRKAVEAAEALAEGVLTEPQRRHHLEGAYTASHEARLLRLSPGDAPGLALTSAAEAAELSLSPLGDDVLLLGATRTSADALAYEAASREAPAADARWREPFPTQDDEDVAWTVGWNTFRENDFFRTPRLAETAAQADLFRCILGNPFRPVTLNPLWLTSTVVSLARQMYESRDFSPMPILADALEEAECNSEGLLSHCRGPGPHVRGCWVLDLVLGKMWPRSRKPQ